MSFSTITRDGGSLRLWDGGTGRPVVMQHGLGGGDAQVAELFPDEPRYRRITLECRGHGGSQPLRPFSIATFADDVLAACDGHCVTRFVAGGVSMGAAIALRLAVLHPDRVDALALIRPAWLTEAAPETMRPNRAVAAALRHRDRAGFAASGTAAHLRREAPDNLASLLGFFDRPDPDMLADLLDSIAADGPGVTPGQLALLQVPTLVIGTAMDAIHPLPTARDLAALIPHARLVEVTPKGLDRARHLAEIRAALTEFLGGIADADR